MNHGQIENTPLLIQLAAASTSTCLVSMFMTPLDLLKTRAQLDHPCRQCHNSLSYRRVIMLLLKEQGGVRSLWTGIGPTLLLGAPSITIYFCCYHRTRNWLLNHGYGQNASPAIAGAFARTLTSSITAPLELMRVVSQARMLTLSALVKTLIRREYRLSALWNSWGLTLLRDVPFSMIYWWFYEYTKRRMDCDRVAPFAAGSVGAFVAATVTCPVDVMKTRLQENGLDRSVRPKQKLAWIDRTLAEFECIYAQRGVRGFYAGIVPRLVKVVPSCSLMIGSYETVLSEIDKRLRPPPVIEPACY